MENQREKKHQNDLLIAKMIEDQITDMNNKIQANFKAAQTKADEDYKKLKE